MAKRYVRKNPLTASWQELGMKPGIRVPGTASWMREWKKNPNQRKMIEYAKGVHFLVQQMSEKNVANYLKKYLTGKWDPEDEEKIAAAIRRMPAWENKFNQMEEQLMSKKDKATQEKVAKKAEGISLKARIEELEKEVESMKSDIANLSDDLVKLTHIKKEKKAKADTSTKKGKEATPDVKGLLKELAAAKEAGDKKLAFGLRGKLRKAGYSLRANGGK